MTNGTRNRHLRAWKQAHTLLAAAMLVPGRATAHASDQSFVLLLPTGAYTTAGVATVLLTVVALFLLPDTVVRRLFGHKPRTAKTRPRGATATSLGAFVLLAALVALGMAGPRDPLSNLLPLIFWTVGWVGIVSLSGVAGNLWHWINPWTGLYTLIAPDWKQRPLPERWGLWPATGVLVAFTAFLLADIAPDDPTRLALFAAAYWAVTMGATLITGPSWLTQVELGHAICTAYARLTAWRTDGIGGPGWHLIAKATPAAGGVFALTLLAAGSFDGINETFFWLGLIGVNPLEFPGRSAVITPTILGLIATVALLLTLFAATVWMGLQLGGFHRLENRPGELADRPRGQSPGIFSQEKLRLRDGASRRKPFAEIYGQLALSLLPIALVYHIAHYLPSFLVSIQYTYAALSDPLHTGADLLGIQPFNVTTGFFNRLDTVRIIWLSQAGLVVLGHVWSVLLSHRIALELFADSRRAALATLPLSLFMIAYTFLGLWLLATPKGA